MHLWQIRHIPNLWQTLVKLTPWLGIGLLAIWLSGFASSFAVDQTDAKSANGKQEPAASKPADSASRAAATEFVGRVHKELQKHQSVKADVEQTVSIGDQQFRASGRYLTSGPKLRVEYTVKPDQGASGSLLEVCDGKELWSLTILADNKRVTHRDIQQIKAAAASARNVPDAVMTAELGFGGLTALFASLERTMNFDAMKQEEIDGHSRTIVQGRWKDEVAKNWRRKPDDPLPVYVPDMVRLVVDSRTLFPERIVYLKKHVEKDKNDKEKKTYRALVSLQFHHVELDAPIDEQEFTFVTPEDVVPEDITRQYLDRLTKSQSDDATSPPSSTTPATKPK